MRQKHDESSASTRRNAGGIAALIAATMQMGDSIVLEEEVDPDYEPTAEEVEEYARWLGMDPTADEDLLHIAREGLKAPLPPDWKPCKSAGSEDVYYFNFKTGDSTWDHPSDSVSFSSQRSHVRQCW